MVRTLNNLLEKLIRLILSLSSHFLRVHSVIILLTQLIRERNYG